MAPPVCSGATPAIHTNSGYMAVSVASPVHPAKELLGPSSCPDSPRNRRRFEANFYCTCCFATEQQQSHLLHDIYIYTYVHMETPPLPTPAAQTVPTCQSGQ